MRWIFWRRKPDSSHGNAEPCPAGEAEEIGVIVETPNSESASGTRVPPAVRDSACARLFRHRRLRKANVIELPESNISSEPAGLLRASDVKLLGSSLLESGLVEQKRLAYFTRGTYPAPGVRPRLIAPSLAYRVAKLRLAARRHNDLLLVTGHEFPSQNSRSKE